MAVDPSTIDLGPMALNAGLGAVAAGAAAALKPMPRREVIGYLLSGIGLAATVPQVAVYYGAPPVMGSLIGVVAGLCGGFLVPKIQKFVGKQADNKMGSNDP